MSDHVNRFYAAVSVLADSQALQQAVQIQVCGCSSPTGPNRTRISVNTFLYRPSGGASTWFICSEPL